MTQPDCIFCRIVAGEIPSYRVYEDDDALAFLDIAPWQEGHCQVISKRHVTDVLADGDVLAELAPAVVAVGNLLKDRLGATACNILSNAGKDAGQEVFHVHVHVLPRYPDSPGIANLRVPVEADLGEVHARLQGG